MIKIGRWMHAIDNYAMFVGMTMSTRPLQSLVDNSMLSKNTFWVHVSSCIMSISDRRITGRQQQGHVDAMQMMPFQEDYVRNPAIDAQI